MPVYAISDELVFPHPLMAAEGGLLAVGGDLSVERLLLAYENGIFPWFSEGDPICWYATNPRFVLFPEKIKVSKSMRKVQSKNKFRLTSNVAFEEVIEACADAW